MEHETSKVQKLRTEIQQMVQLSCLPEAGAFDERHEEHAGRVHEGQRPIGVRRGCGQRCCRREPRRGNIHCCTTPALKQGSYEIQPLLCERRLYVMEIRGISKQLDEEKLQYQ